jgi:hypothetical protein
MLAAIRAKFTQHPDLCAQLLATCDAWLAEHTTRDRYWGDGGDGSGQNQLGRLLMQIRSKLKTQAVPSANQIVLNWLLAAGKIDLHRSAQLELAPTPHAAPVPWERVEGMLLGLAIGDALGNTSESIAPAKRHECYGEIRDYLPNDYAGGTAMLWDLLGRTTPPAADWWLDAYVAVARDLEGATAYATRGGEYRGYRGPLWHFVAERVSDAHAPICPFWRRVKRGSPVLISSRLCLR